MSNDIEREAFERQFPVPAGVVWAPEQKDYTYTGIRFLDRCVAYSNMWEVWQAARAQQGEAEPVAFGVFYQGVFHEHAYSESAALGVAEDYQGLQGITVQPLYTQPPTATGGAPEGWASRFVRLMGEIQSELEDAQDDPIPAELWSLWRDLLTAAPSPEQPKPRSRYGADAPYFHGKLSLVLRDLENYTPDELARALARLVVVADKDVLAEPEFTPEQGQAAPGSGWIRCSEEMPKLGQRVRLFSQGVIQHYTSVFDEGDEGPFWSFDGICDYDPPVDFNRDQWKPMDQPPQGEG